MIPAISTGNRPTICVACYRMNTRYWERVNDNSDDSVDNYDGGEDDDRDNYNVEEGRWR